MSGRKLPAPVQPLEAVEPELAALFARESIPTPSRGASTRVLGRVAASIAMAEAAPIAVATAARSLSARTAGLLATTFAVGAAVGASVALVLRPVPIPSVTYVERQITTPSTLPPRETAPSSTSVEPNAVEPRKVAPTPRPSALDTLGDERAIIEDARSKLASGDANGALRRLDEHARRFPSAHLVEEREALAIQALVNAARHDGARQRADTFRARWPSSMYLPVVEATVGSIP